MKKEILPLVFLAISVAIVGLIVFGGGDSANQSQPASEPTREFTPQTDVDDNSAEVTIQVGDELPADTPVVEGGVIKKEVTGEAVDFQILVDDTTASLFIELQNEAESKGWTIDENTSAANQILIGTKGSKSLKITLGPDTLTNTSKTLVTILVN